jgi:hypothetical protein
MAWAELVEVSKQHGVPLQTIGEAINWTQAVAQANAHNDDEDADAEAAHELESPATKDPVETAANEDTPVADPEDPVYVALMERMKDMRLKQFGGMEEEEMDIDTGA